MCVCVKVLTLKVIVALAPLSRETSSWTSDLVINNGSVHGVSVRKVLICECERLEGKKGGRERERVRERESKQKLETGRESDTITQTEKREEMR